MALHTTSHICPFPTTTKSTRHWWQFFSFIAMPAPARRHSHCHRFIPVLRTRDCWKFIGALGVVYLCGVQWGIYMAYQRQSRWNNEGEEVFMIRGSLEAWSAMWESYVEPIFETVYRLDGDEGGEEGDDSSASSRLIKLGGILTSSGHDTKTDRSPKWEPEIPRFTAPDTLKLPKPIINVGFPKAGTSSIFSFFHCNGLKGQHWFCCEEQNHPAGTKHRHLMSRCILENLIENHRFQLNISRPRKDILEGCGDYDFYSEINGPRVFEGSRFRILNDDGTHDTRSHTKREPRLILPQHHYLEDLHAQFPNATFILNLRPTHEWVESVMRWGTTLRVEIPNEFWVQDQLRGFSAFADNVTLQHHGITGRLPPKKVSVLNVTLAYLMDYHSNYVREFVRRHPSHTLLEVDITRNETGQILADAFGLNETCWAKRNENKKTNQTVGDFLLGNDKFHSFLEQTSNRKMMLGKELAKKKQDTIRARKNKNSGGRGMLQNVLSGIFGISEDGSLPEDENNEEEKGIPDQTMDISELEKLRGERIQRLKGGTHKGKRKGVIPKRAAAFDGWGKKDGHPENEEDTSTTTGSNNKGSPAHFEFAASAGGRE
jgi:hypothetical protein